MLAMGRSLFSSRSMRRHENAVAVSVHLGLPTAGQRQLSDEDGSTPACSTPSSWTEASAPKSRRPEPTERERIEELVARRDELIADARAELRRLSPEARGTSVAISELAELLRSAGELEEARALFEEALAARRAQLGDEHPATSVSLNNLGLLLREMGQLRAARVLLAEAVETRRLVQGSKHPETLTAINNLGALLKASGDLDAAEPLYKEALLTRREVLGHSHPDTLTSINNLASLLQVACMACSSMHARRSRPRGARACTPCMCMCTCILSCGWHVHGACAHRRATTRRVTT